MAKTREVKEGEVYLPRRCSRYTFRRVVGVREGRVCYSAGGDHNHWCSLASFRRAVKPEPVTQEQVATIAGTI